MIEPGGETEKSCQKSREKLSGVWCHETKRIFQDKAKGQQYQIGQIKSGPKRLSPDYKHLCAFAQTILQLETIFLSRIVSNRLTFVWWFTKHHHMLPHLLTKILRVKPPLMYLGIPLSSLKCECSRFRKGIKFAVKAPWKEENLWMGRAGPQARTIACPCQQDDTAKTSLRPHRQVMKHCPWLFRKRYSHYPYMQTYWMKWWWQAHPAFSPWQ